MRTIGSTLTPTPPAREPTGGAHLSDPTLAQALLAVWSGDPLVTVDSPPGAGKTRLVTHLAAQLATRAGLRVAIAAQTRVQAADLAGRIADLGALVGVHAGRDSTRPPGLDRRVAHLNQRHHLGGWGGIVIATTARWLHTPHTQHTADVLLIDEAYQLTHADLGALGALAAQFVLVGDPGQIDPVVTADTTRWATHPAGPHLPAPTALRAIYPDEQITLLRLPHTWRCGPSTTALIQPTFYPDLPFTSARPDVHLTTPAGPPLPEISTTTVPTAAGPNDPAIAHTAAAAVRTLLTATLHDSREPAPRPLTAADIGVITPHVTQANLLTALLADLHPDLLIGTANAVQGAERQATVVIHPLTGHTEATPFTTDPGRTCVALTRHRAHCQLLTDPRAPTLLHRAHHEQPHPHITVQQTLLDALST